MTADVAGIAIIVSGSAAQGAGSPGPTLTIGVVTALQGPNAWCADNFGGSLPTSTGDDVVFENSAVDLLYGLAPSTDGIVPMVAFDPTTVTQKNTYTGKIGLPRTNVTFGYVEYRPQFLTLGNGGAFPVDLGQGDGSGSGRIKIDTTSSTGTVSVYNSGARVETGIPATLLNGTATGNVVHVNRGDVGLGFFDGDTYSYETLNVGFVSSRTGDSKVVIGDGCTQKSTGTITQSGGQLQTSSNLRTVTVEDGTLSVTEGASVAALNLYGGKCTYNSTGTLTIAEVAGGSVLDFRGDQRPRTVTKCNLHKGGAVHDPNKTVTWSTGIDLIHCSDTEVVMETGTHIKVTFGSVV